MSDHGYPFDDMRNGISCDLQDGKVKITTLQAQTALSPDDAMFLATAILINAIRARPNMLSRTLGERVLQPIMEELIQVGKPVA